MCVWLKNSETGLSIWLHRQNGPHIQNGIDLKCIERKRKRDRDRDWEKESKGKRWSIKEQNNQCHQRYYQSNSIEFLFNKSRRSSECFVVLLCFITLNTTATLRIYCILCEWFPWASEFHSLKRLGVNGKNHTSISFWIY